MNQFEQVWKKDADGNEYCDDAAFWRNLARHRMSFEEATEEYKKRMENYDVKGALELIL